MSLLAAWNSVKHSSPPSVTKRSRRLFWLPAARVLLGWGGGVEDEAQLGRRASDVVRVGFGAYTDKETYNRNMQIGDRERCLDT